MLLFSFERDEMGRGRERGRNKGASKSSCKQLRRSTHVGRGVRLTFLETRKSFQIFVQRVPQISVRCVCVARPSLQTKRSHPKVLFPAQVHFPSSPPINFPHSLAKSQCHMPRPIATIISCVFFLPTYLPTYPLSFFFSFPTYLLLIFLSSSCLPFLPYSFLPS